MSTLKGPVRFRFRRPEDDVDVLIQGDIEWVEALRSDLGLADVGWIQPIAATGRTAPNPSAEESDNDDEGYEITEEDSVLLESDTEPVLPGPPPDPSRIPVVRRIVGSMDLDEEMEKLGIESPKSPTAEELSDLLSEMDEPEPITTQVSTDPIAEAWLQRLMKIAVRKFGDTDKKEKVTGGKNGYGAKLANIFSTKFVVETVDRIRKKHYIQTFTDNHIKIIDEKIFMQNCN